MVPFATEFPVQHPVNRAAFVAQVVAWLRGTRYSTVLEDRRDTDLSGETAFVSSPNGEELRLRELSAEGMLEAIGFRHDFPDQEGRLWRTEIVLRRNGVDDLHNIIRVRTQCIAKIAGARLESPKKPFIVKTLIGDNWGGRDGEFDVTDQPHWLSEDEKSLSLARRITLGSASEALPVIYVSAVGTSHWLLSKGLIEKLAYDLSGVAHVSVEPNRDFSFNLRETTKGKNVYSGTIGIALPDQGIIRRFYMGWKISSASDIASAVTLAAFAIRSQMPTKGWDWTELQEQALRRQRERDRNRLSAEESERLYLEEIENLQDRVKQLEEQINTRPIVEASEQIGDFILPHSVLEKCGPEIYPGEYCDRIQMFAQTIRGLADRTGLDRRSSVVLDGIIDSIQSSLGLSELRKDLERATKNPKRAASDVATLLSRHGYRAKSDNKHVRLEAQDGYIGLDALTLAKTPSEKRGLKNLRKQIERTLGLSKLSR